MRHFYLLLTLMAILVPSSAKADITVHLETNTPIASFVVLINGYNAERHDWNSEGAMILTFKEGEDPNINLNVNSGYVINSISLDGEQIANDITSNYYVNPSALYDGCTLIVQASERPKTNVTIYGDPSQIKVAYMYQTYDESSWDAGTLSITLQDPYSSVTISARDGFGLQGVNVNGNNELQPGSRTFTLYPSTLKPGDNRVEVSSYSMADERSSHFTVIVNGDPASVSLRLAGDSYDITGDALNAPIAFNPDFDLPIRIEPNIYGHTFYRVMADGTEIIPSDGSYKIAELADNGVITIDADYPDKDIPVRLSFVNPDTEGAVLRVSDTQFNVIPREQWLAPDFTVKMGTVVHVGFDAANYTVSADFNGRHVEGNNLSFTATDEAGYNIEVTAEPMAPYEVTFYYESLPAHFHVLRGNMNDDVVEMTGQDETVVSVARNLNRIRIVPDEGWLVTYVYVDGVEGTTDFQVSGNATVEVYVEEYARDLKASVYLDPAMEWNYCGVTLCGDDESKKQVIDLTAGYNLVSFNADDMPFEFEVRCGVPEYYMYFDGELCSDAISSDMFSLIDLKDGSVVKLYAGLPAMCDVRLEVEDGVDAIVMHDIVAEVSASEALTLPAGTMITVKPATATEIKVMAGEREILADSEGAYNFIVEESCTIVVSAGTVSGISAIEGGDRADVYSLQGVCVLKEADTAALRALPRGCYIISGRKVWLR